MPPSQPAAIRVAHLSKHFGDVVAVDDVSFSVPPGAVVGYLGPRAAGKTTTLRVLLGELEPTAGSALIGGARFGDLAAPHRVVGAVIDSLRSRPSHTAREHLAARAAALGGASPSRIGRLLADVGLAEVGGERVGALPASMRRRLDMAGALVGGPRVLILDEPASGLDREGIEWMHATLRAFADGGGAVLMTSRVLTEVAPTVDELVIVNAGRVVAQGSIGDVLSRASRPSTRIRTPDHVRLTALLIALGHRYDSVEHGELHVHDLAPGEIDALAAANDIVIEHMSIERLDLSAPALPVSEPVER